MRGLEMNNVVEGLERKFCQLGDEIVVTDGRVIEGYASLFGKRDQGGDIVEPGAYGRSLASLDQAGRRVKMLWQHDPREPIGVWDEVREDSRGLYVKGRLLTEVGRAREASALIAAGAIDGLSIGYRTVRSSKGDQGGRRLSELELWEVSLVTFPMLTEARVDSKGARSGDRALRDMAEVLEQARRELARGRAGDH